MEWHSMLWTLFLERNGSSSSNLRGIKCKWMDRDWSTCVVGNKFFVFRHDYLPGLRWFVLHQVISRFSRFFLNRKILGFLACFTGQPPSIWTILQQNFNAINAIDVTFPELLRTAVCPPTATDWSRFWRAIRNPLWWECTSYRFTAQHSVKTLVRAWFGNVLEIRVICSHPTAWPLVGPQSVGNARDISNLPLLRNKVFIPCFHGTCLNHVSQSLNVSNFVPRILQQDSNIENHTSALT